MARIDMIPLGPKTLAKDFEQLLASTLTPEQADIYGKQLQVPAAGSRTDAYAAIASALSTAINQAPSVSPTTALATTLHLLAFAESEAGHAAEAAAQYEKVMTIHQSNGTYPTGCLASIVDLGPVLLRLGRPDEVERILRPLQLALEDAVGPRDPRTLACMRCLAEALSGTGAEEETADLLASLETRVNSLTGLVHIEEAAALLQLQRRLV